MAQGTRNELSLFEEAKVGLSSLIQQTVAVFAGFALMLLLTGGAPSGFAIALSFCLGTAFVSWSEQKRVRNLKAVDSSMTLKNPDPRIVVTQKRPQRNSIILENHNLLQTKLREQQHLREMIRMLEVHLSRTASPVQKFELRLQLEELMGQLERSELEDLTDISKDDVESTSRPNWTGSQSRSEEIVDSSDVSALIDDFFERTTGNTSAEQAHNLVQLDPDVKQWFQAQGKQYKTLINNVLRQYMESHRTR